MSPFLFLSSQIPESLKSKDMFGSFTLLSLKFFSRSVRPDNLQVSCMAVDDLPGSRLVNAETLMMIIVMSCKKG
ncbi:hypothetical protein YC2023_024431 [Brassica napus]